MTKIVNYLKTHSFQNQPNLFARSSLFSSFVVSMRYDLWRSEALRAFQVRESLSRYAKVKGCFNIISNNCKNNKPENPFQSYDGAKMA